jgi:CheY-like chemotaxis protein
LTQVHRSLETDRSIFKILMIDDDVEDIELTREAIKECGFNFELLTIDNGQTILEYIKKNQPQLVLLDLNMPKTDGKFILQLLKSNPIFRMIPIIIFSTSNRDDDIKQSYKIGANGYIVKPSIFSEWVNVMEQIGRFWSHQVHLVDQSRFPAREH